MKEYKNMHVTQKPIYMVVLIAIILGTLGGGVFLYNKHLDEKNRSAMQAEGISVEVDRVRLASINRVLNVVGNLAASNTVTVRAQVRAQVSKVIAQGGEEVGKDAPLFELDDRPFKAALKEAQARLALAQEGFKRSESLANKKFASSKTLDESRAQLLTAEAQVEKAQKDLDDTKIIAPYEGVISLHKVSIGSTVSPDVELLTITDIDPIKVDFKIPAQYSANLSIGQEVQLRVDSLPDQKFTGTIDAIDAQVDAATQQVSVRANIDNSKRILKPGLFAQVTVNVGSKDATLVVPEESIEATPDQSYAYKVIEHPEHPGVYVVFRVPVRTGIEEGDKVEVTAGLNEGDIVLTVGQNKVKDGYPVRFDPNTIAQDKPSDTEKSSDEKGKGTTAPDSSKFKSLKDMASQNPVSKYLKGFFNPKKDAEGKTKDEGAAKTEEKAPIPAEKKVEPETQATPTTTDNGADKPSNDSNRADVKEDQTPQAEEPTPAVKEETPATEKSEDTPATPQGEVKTESTPEAPAETVETPAPQEPEAPALNKDAPVKDKE